MSKRIWQHPEVPAGETTVSWRGVGQLEDTPAFRTWMEREFPQGVAEMNNQEDAETSRRSFLKLMGASTALAGFGLAACRRPESYIVPYNKAPEWVIPGKATYYASSRPSASGAVPLVVTTFEGRPTKLAPNSLHPDICGTDSFTQASILDLYSPSRSRKTLKQGKPVARGEFEAVLATLAADKAAKIGFVFGEDVSPTRARLAKELVAKFPAAQFYSYEALTSASPFLGDGVRPVADFSKADRVLALDCDFASLDFHGSTIPFFQRRKPEGGDYSKKPDAAAMNRMYAIESAFSLTGGMADHRLRVKPSQIAGITAYIAAALGVSQVTPSEATTDEKVISWLKPLVADLQGAGSKAIVLAGSRLPEGIRILAAAINEKLGNTGEGKALRYVRTENEGFGDIAKLKADLDGGTLDTLFLLTPGNPVLDAPADLKIAESFAKAKTVIHLGERTDATARAATWHVPASHYLESWSDARTVNGVYTVVQPMILPLYDECASELEILSALLTDEGKLVTGEGEAGAPSPAYTEVKKTFAAVGGKSTEAWRKLLRDGFQPGTSYETASVTLPAGKVTLPTASAEGLEVVFATDASVYDGRWIDNGWLQEAPDPISKLCWDNAALIAPQTAKDLGLYDEIVALEHKRAGVGEDGEGEHRTGPVIRIKLNGAELEIAVMISFGQSENTIVLPLGYGQGFDDEDKFNRGPKHTGTTGQVGMNSGFNAYPLRTTATSYYATGAVVENANKRYPLAVIQEHHAMYGRALAREISTIDSGDHKGGFEEQLHNVKLQGNDGHAPPNISLYKQEGVKGADGKPTPHLSDKLHQWAMTVDLSSCMGCNACLIACQAENNIPIVGKQQVAMGREMHWVRMDRYYAIDKENTFDPGNPELICQPVSCVQCESAPCETVCPVNATVHTEDGLNAMAYNRCIGTRYCANNCPYKARRFNFFDYNKRNPLVAHNLYKGPLGEKQVGTAPHLQRNPNVTVRMRGVMEKCTYCVQRLKDAVIRQKRGQKQEALLSGKASPDSGVTENTLRVSVDGLRVACQEACPAGGIEFGNLLDGDKSAMNRAKASERNYDLLHYIGTKPRTSYLARVKNPNAQMPDSKFVGKATIHMH
ncbi:TAT-variant-translocated molybdopterin oxidoreductase [Luteolibacter flavescens]|uniref:TAT-variant-translocated molybdopterin oxidoreductase n=1 Tax=Luteolibacter flavescens TaxID=1859460 RepID=A0ABT3FPA9_9BACT|nr:TAT-variant-translocated molybdopterin oxidoreductase [Luteolibacter flavescens]MCW1885406.1 TAT-variant-translocated molybdopterin oxidoreductase [Luteolibacter flavescens]